MDETGERGFRRPTQRDVARHAGVSTATVSYVLSGRGHGAPPTAGTAERVLRAVADLGYELDHRARSLRRRRSDTVAVIYRGPSSPWTDGVIEQLQEHSAARGLTVIVLPVGPRTPPSTVWRPLREGYADAAIVLSGLAADEVDLPALAARGMALLVVDENLAPEGFDVVRQRRLAACTAAMRRLIAIGHRRIAFLGEEGARADVSPGLRSYTETLAAHDITLDPALVRRVADSRSRSYTAVQELLRLPDPPTALFSATDRAAIDAIWAAKDQGRRVPEDLAVVGVGNIPEGAVISPPLTTVGAREFDFAPLIRRLLDRLDQTTPLPGEVLEVPWTLIERGSG